jgi:putative transposase
LEHHIAPNVLNRKFGAAASDQSWVADFTYVWTGEGWLYLAVVLDLYSRHVVGWSMSARKTAHLVMDALLMAVGRRGEPKKHCCITPTRAVSTPARTSSACFQIMASLAA